jgi:hypothetical protein
MKTRRTQDTVHYLIFIRTHLIPKRENRKIFELQTPHSPAPVARGGGVLSAS